MTLNHDLVLKASAALLKHIEKQQNDESSNNLLGGGDEPVQLVFSMKKLSASARHKPYRVPLRTPLYDETMSVCLITKNSDEQHIEKLESLNIPQIKAIVPLEKLKTTYKAFEARRQLVAEHDLFLVDDRILTLMPEVLGSKFYKAAKMPVPVNIVAKNLKNEFTKALGCTYYRATKGTCTVLKIGTTALTAAQLADNIESAANYVASNIVSKKWDGIQSIGIKTRKSLTLPIFNSLPTPAMVIDTEAPEADGNAMDAADASSDDEEKEQKIEAVPEPKIQSKKSPMSRFASNKKAVSALKNARSKSPKAPAATKA
ncbi:proteasome-interacting protein cic1 [Coemansia sp. Benny D115]|nr:proteasome-interacting protein cic1 [Coemansia sp. Benny D115]